MYGNFFRFLLFLLYLPYLPLVKAERRSVQLWRSLLPYLPPSCPTCPRSCPICPHSCPSCPPFLPRLPPFGRLKTEFGWTSLMPLSSLRPWLLDDYTPKMSQMDL